ncbi:efflux RND transporter permease subunit, partial [Acinetobacter baumannii]
PSRNPLWLIHVGFNHGFEAMRAAYAALLAAALRHRLVFSAGFLTFVLASFLLTPYLGRNFFPSVDSGQILMHARNNIGTRVEENAR